MVVTWALLLAAIGVEVAATASLSRTQGFRDPGWTAFVLLGYASSIWLLSLVVRHISVSVAYAVWSAIGELEPKPRAAVLLFYAHGESCEGIGRILGVPAGTVKTWLHRSRHQIRHRADALLAGQPAAGGARSGDLT